MTLHEALAELGIAMDASPDQARRAYLKLLKTRKPEVDPQGFMRLREAYDLVKGMLEARDAWSHVFAEAAPRPAPEPPSAPAAEPEPAPAPETAPEHAPESPAEAEGGAQGNAEDGWEGDEEPPSLSTVDALLAEGNREGAALELARLFDAAAEALDRTAPPLMKAVHLHLALHADGALEHAAALHASVVAWLDASGRETQLLQGHGAVVFAVARELDALPRSFPKPVRTAIARGASTGDLDEARARLDALQRRRPGVAQKAAAKLRRRAPLLASQFADVLDPPPSPPPRASRWTSWSAIIVASVLLNVFARLLFSSGSSSAPPVKARLDPSPPPSVLAEGRAREQQGDPTDWTKGRRAVLEWASSISNYARSMQGANARGDEAKYALLETNARAVADAVRRGDCVAAHEARRALQRTMPAGDEVAPVEVSTLSKALNDHCKPSVDERSEEQ